MGSESDTALPRPSPTLKHPLAVKSCFLYSVLAGSERICGAPCGCPVCGFAMARRALSPVHERSGEANRGKIKETMI